MPQSFDPVREMRERRLLQRIVSMGAPAVLYLLRDVESHGDLGVRLEEYASLDADFIRSLGGDHWPDPTLWLVTRTEETL